MFNFFKLKQEPVNLLNPVYTQMRRILNIPVNGRYFEGVPSDVFKYENSDNSYRLYYFFDNKWWLLHRAGGTIARTIKYYGEPHTVWDKSSDKPDISLTSGSSFIRFYVSPYSDNSVMIEAENVNYNAAKIKELLDNLYSDMTDLANYQAKAMNKEQLELEQKINQAEFYRHQKDILAKSLGENVSALYYLS